MVKCSIIQLASTKGKRIQYRENNSDTVDADYTDLILARLFNESMATTSKIWTMFTLSSIMISKFRSLLNEQIESNLIESVSLEESYKNEITTLTSHFKKATSALTIENDHLKEVILVSTTKKLQNKSSHTVKQSTNSVNIQTINKCIRDSDTNTEVKCTRNYATQINNIVSLENSTCMNSQTTLRECDEKILSSNTSLFEEMQISIFANTCNSNTDDGNVLVSYEQLSSHSSNGNMSVLSSNNQQCNVPVEPNPIRSSTQINATKKKCNFTTSAHNQGRNLTNLIDKSSRSNINFQYTLNNLNTTPNLKNILLLSDSYDRRIAKLSIGDSLIVLAGSKDIENKASSNLFSHIDSCRHYCNISNVNFVLTTIPYRYDLNNKILRTNNKLIKAYLKTQSAERAGKGFATTGIYLTRRNIFNEEDFLPIKYQDVDDDDPQTARNTTPRPLLSNAEEEKESRNENVSLVVNLEDIAPIPNVKKKWVPEEEKQAQLK
ncbi:hypothetical protein FQA39_LY17826 [Lamprigera yunnana]|nr:hypothetical protein FQA39_LY17826 [Lamprigera yunnana]